MNDLTTFVSTVVGALNDAGFPYLVTGSFASIVYSEPRTTMDIDVVVHAPFERLEEFRQRMLALGLYAPSIDATTDMFNVIDLESGWKADIICWQDEPFEHERVVAVIEAEREGPAARHRPRPGCSSQPRSRHRRTRPNPIRPAAPPLLAAARRSHP